MGEYAHLNLSTSSVPSADSAEYLSGETEVLFKWGVGMAWLALFEPKNILVQPCYPFGIDDEAFPGLYLLSDISAAVRRFDLREPNLTQLIGPPWAENVDEFRQYLDNPKATHVELDVHELLDDDRPPEVLKEYYEEILRAFDEPLYSGKKTLLTGKPKLSRGWSKIRKEVQGLTSGNIDPSLLFGSREGWSWW